MDEKKQTIFDVKARKKKREHYLRVRKKRKKDVVEKLPAILSKRIDNYALKLIELKWATDDQHNEFKNRLFNEAQERYINFYIRKFMNETQTDPEPYDYRQLCIDLDEILCFLDPRFESIVEHRPNKRKRFNSIQGTKSNPVIINSDNNVSKKNDHKKNKINFDEEIKKIIKITFGFYKNPKNSGKYPTQKYLADNTGISASTLTRRYTKEDAPKFLKRFELIIDEKLGQDKCTQDQNDILLNLKHEIKNKINSLQTKDFSVIPSKEKPLNPSLSEDGSIMPKQSFGNDLRYENEEVFSALDGQTKVDRKCNNCGKTYKISITEDDDFEKWETAAKKNPEFFKKLVCSDQCFEEIQKNF